MFKIGISTRKLKWYFSFTLLIANYIHPISHLMFILLGQFYMCLEKLVQKYLNCWIIEFVKIIKKTFNMQKHDNFPYVKCLVGKQLAKSLITRQKKKESSLYCTRYVIHRKQQLRNVLIPNGKYCVSYAWNDN